MVNALRRFESYFLRREQFFESSQVWRDGREAEGTGLLNLHIRKGIEGSNPSLSVRRGRTQSRRRGGEDVVRIEPPLELQQPGQVGTVRLQGAGLLRRAQQVRVAAEEGVRLERPG